MQAVERRGGQGADWRHRWICAASEGMSCVKRQRVKDVARGMARGVKRSVPFSFLLISYALQQHTTLSLHTATVAK